MDSENTTQEPDSDEEKIVPKRINAKQKAYRQTFDVLQSMNVWWREPFRATPASGALRWGETNVHWTFGDLVPPLSFPFCVELKNWKDFPIQEVLTKEWDQARLSWFWYGQTFRDASEATKVSGQIIYPMMIYKENGTKNRIVLQSSLFLRLPQDLLSQMAYVEIKIPQADPFCVVWMNRFFSVVKRPLFEHYILGRDVSTKIFDD